MDGVVGFAAPTDEREEIALHRLNRVRGIPQGVDAESLPVGNLGRVGVDHVIDPTAPADRCEEVPVRGLVGELAAGIDQQPEGLAAADRLRIRADRAANAAASIDRRKEMIELADLNRELTWERRQACFHGTASVFSTTRATPVARCARPSAPAAS